MAGGSLCARLSSVLLAAVALAAGGHLPYQAPGSAAGHWCIHDLFRALGALSSLIGA
ncbi:hypothetical protein SAMN05216189_100937 [Pseudomonas delhiensis]|uniref:Uncharacterized protein n=1 Tax=Pseudomonas delhiensis TaxID=366289 RepID=A0A239GYG4_9PSED|nr:hypothetical protein [Pseudomonas delhiensis]SDI80736.1 hypothetical protein SAMN05216189_100937 [Pseudomonas delhiensis]SNS73838.1 hypothetical protein SAMN06295949_10698 [Pseudomonas delhiensis]